jgi:hypothetical protein
MTGCVRGERTMKLADNGSGMSIYNLTTIYSVILNVVVISISLLYV